MDVDSTITRNRLIAAIGVVSLVLGLAWFATWTGLTGGSAIPQLILTFADSAPAALGWFVGAFGFGWFALQVIGRRGGHDPALQIALGVGVMLLIDAALGSRGLLNPVSAWLLYVLGLIGVVLQGRVVLTNLGDEPANLDGRWWILVPALIALIGAASVAPGWIWASEFGGYDALSYHLQLPREWLAEGRIGVLEHNVYSALPGFVEAAYLHLMMIVGPERGLVASQYLHGLIALATAGVAASAARRMMPAERRDDVWNRVMAAVLVLGTPWVVVTGSLAYNEMVVCLMLAGCIALLVEEGGWSERRRAWLLSFLCAVAIGAKLTAVFFVLLPVLGLALWMRGRRLLTFGCIVGALIIGLATLSPWLIRNAADTGNPVFPFASSLFDAGHWTEAQFESWSQGHGPPSSFGDRLGEAWNQFARYGIGSNPDASGFEPWSPQWIILPWLAFACLIVGVSLKTTKRAAIGLGLVLVIQLIGWIMFTHIKSRFMVPAAIPSALLVVLAASLIPRDGRAFAGVTSAVLLCWSAVPLLLLSGEQDGRPARMVGEVRLRSGNALTTEQRQDVGMNVFPACAVNWLLPVDSHVLLVGESAPLYFDLERIDYTTVWDRGAMSDVLQDAPDDPVQWCGLLRDRGYTHVLINPTMLDIWADSGWADPNLDPIPLMAGFATAGDVIVTYEDGTTIIRLR